MGRLYFIIHRVLKGKMKVLNDNVEQFKTNIDQIQKDLDSVQLKYKFEQGKNHSLTERITHLEFMNNKIIIESGKRNSVCNIFVIFRFCLGHQ
jgi:hypothetical protein